MVTFAPATKTTSPIPTRAAAQCRVSHFVAIACSDPNDSCDLVNADCQTLAQLVSPSRDPIGYSGGVSEYTYVLGRPSIMLDWSGKLATSTMYGLGVAWSEGCEEECRAAATVPDWIKRGGGVFCSCSKGEQTEKDEHGNTYRCSWRRCKKCACLFEIPLIPILVGKCPAQDACGIAHEVEHISQTKTCDLSKLGLNPIGPKVPADYDKNECAARIREIDCLNKALKSEKSNECMESIKNQMYAQILFVNENCKKQVANPSPVVQDATSVGSH